MLGHCSSGWYPQQRPIGNIGRLSSGVSLSSARGPSGTARRAAGSWSAPAAVRSPGSSPPPTRPRCSSTSSTPARPRPPGAPRHRRIRGRSATGPTSTPPGAPARHRGHPQTRRRRHRHLTLPWWGRCYGAWRRPQPSRLRPSPGDYRSLAIWARWSTSSAATWVSYSSTDIMP